MIKDRRHSVFSECRLSKLRYIWIINRVPFPGSLTTWISQPWSSTIHYTMESPRPEPLRSRA